MAALLHKRWFTFTLLVLLLIGIPGRAAETYRVGTIEGSSLTDDQKQLIHTLIEDEISRHATLSKENDKPRGTIDISLTHLDRAYLVQASLQGQKKTKREELKISSLDEIDVAVRRLAAALLEGVSVGETAERGSAVDAEQREPSKLRSIRGWEVYFGGAWPLTDSFGSHKTMYNFGIGHTWDVRKFLIEIAGHFQAGYNDLDMGTTSIGVGLHRVFFERRTTAFYAGPDFGFAIADDVGSKSKSGFGIAGNAGLILFRQADINMDMRFRLMMLADKLNGEVPVTGSFSVGIRF